MTVLDGKIIAREIKASVKESAEQYRQQGIVPTLAIVLATGNGGAVEMLIQFERRPKHVQ